MRRIAMLCAVLCFLASTAVAQQSPDMQQKIAAIHEAAARNAEALHSYSWVTKTEIMVKGEVKNTKVEQCQYGPDGQVEKTLLSEPQQQEQQQSGGRRRRGGRVKEAIVEHKTEEMQEEMQTTVALVHSYVPPTGDKIQAVVAAGGVSLVPAADGHVAIRLADYQKEGDLLTLTLDAATHALQHVAVNTWLDEPDKEVTLDVQFASLSDGTSYAATTVLAIPDDEIEVHIENSNYQKVGR